MYRYARNIRISRALKPALISDLEIYPVVAVMGARQVGKSRLCRQIASERDMLYQNLDDRDVLQEARSDPEGLLARAGERGCYID